MRFILLDSILSTVATLCLAACDVCEQGVGWSLKDALSCDDLYLDRRREPCDWDIRTKASQREAADPEGSQPGQGEKFIPVGSLKTTWS